MQRSTQDLVYLWGTCDEDGSTNHDSALFGRREERMVEHGWRQEKYGETTQRGAEIASKLPKVVDDLTAPRVGVHEDSVEYIVRDTGVVRLLNKIDSLNEGPESDRE